MLSLRFQSINIVNKLGSDCGNGTDVYVSVSGLTIGRAYTLTIEKISEYGTITAYNAPHTFLAESTELNNYLIKTVLLNARYFVLKAKITDDKNQIVFAEDLTTVDCLTTSVTATQTPSNTPAVTESPTPTPTYSQTPTYSPSITPSAQAFDVCIGTDKSSYSLNCCSGTAYAQHHKIVLGLVNLNPDNNYTISATSQSGYIKTYISESAITPSYSNKLVDLYVSLNKNKTECAENKITITVSDSAGAVLRTRNINVHCILSDSEIVPDSYDCEEAIGVYFEDTEKTVCLHFDDSCPRYVGKATVVPNFTPTPTQTKTPTVTPTYSRTPTISLSSENSANTLSYEEKMRAMSGHDSTVNLKTQIHSDYNIVGDEYESFSSQVANSLHHNNQIYICGNYDCYKYDGPANTSAFISRVLTENDVLVVDNTFGYQGRSTLSHIEGNSKFNFIKAVETRNNTRIMAFGTVKDNVVVSTFLQSGVEDTSFAGNGHLILDTVHDYKINNIFDAYVDKDNTVVLFLDANNTNKKHNCVLLMKIDFNGNIINLNNQLTITEIRPSLPEFNYSQILGKKVIQDSDNLYIVYEAFSAVSKNTVVITKVGQSFTIDENFGMNGFRYSSMNGSSDHHYVTAFVKEFSFSAATKDDFNGYIETESGSYRNFNFTDTKYKLLYLSVLNKDGSITLQKCNTDGDSYSVNLDSTEPVSEDVTVSLTVNSINTIIHSPVDFSELESYFEDVKIETNAFSVNGNTATVQFLPLSVNLVNSGKDVLLPVNLKVKSVENISDSGETKNLQQFEDTNVLLSGDFKSTGLTFRNCELLPCDRQPEDSYGSLIINNQKLNKFKNSERVYMGYILLSNNLSLVSGVKLDSFDNLNVHNIVTNSINQNGDKYFVIGHSGGLGNFEPFIKITDLLDAESSDYGTYLTDIIYRIHFAKICG